MKHNLEISFNFFNSKMLVDVHNEQYRNIVQFSILPNYNITKERSVFFNLLPFIVKKVQNSYNIL